MAKNKTNISNSPFSKALKYSQSTVEYGGMVAWGMISKCYPFIVPGFSKSSKTEYKKGLKSLKRTKSKKMDNSDADLLEIKDRIALLEKKLADLEKHGIRVSDPAPTLAKKMEINEDKKALLRLILDENRMLT